MCFTIGLMLLRSLGGNLVFCNNPSNNIIKSSSLYIARIFPIVTISYISSNLIIIFFGLWIVVNFVSKMKSSWSFILLLISIKGIYLFSNTACSQKQDIFTLTSLLRAKGVFIHFENWMEFYMIPQKIFFRRNICFLILSGSLEIFGDSLLYITWNFSMTIKFKVIPILKHGTIKSKTLGQFWLLKTF